MTNLGRQFAAFFLLIGTGAGLSAPRAETPEVQLMPELQAYVGARSVVDLSPAELLRSYPELKNNLIPAPEESELPGILRRVGENVELFFRHLPNTTSVEDVRQEVRRSDGSVVSRSSSRFDYLMLSGYGDSVGLDEFRTNRRGEETGPLGPASGFMFTSSCVWHLVHLHPKHQAESRFRYIGKTSKPEAHVIAFAQKPEDAKQVAQIGVWGAESLRYEIAILIQGIAWVDAATFQVVRARTDLLAARTDIGLARDTTEIECAEIHFEGMERTFWLPREVTVTSAFRNFVYSNRHRYSGYRIFSVETWEKINPPVKPEPPPQHFGDGREWRLVKGGRNHLVTSPNQLLKPRRGGAGKPRA